MGRPTVWHYYVCFFCSKKFKKTGLNQRRGKRVFCSQQCAWKVVNIGKTKGMKHKKPHPFGEKHPNWKGGSISTQGYRLRGRRGLEHRVFIEEHLGRKLKRTEHVHHINGNKTDNRLENLEVIDIRNHGRMHSLQRWRGR